MKKPYVVHLTSKKLPPCHIEYKTFPPKYSENNIFLGVCFVFVPARCVDDEVGNGNSLLASYCCVDVRVC